MISKVFLYYPGFPTPQERVDWVKNALVSHCGMSVSVDTRPITDGSTEYYCVLGNSSNGKIWIEDDDDSASPNFFYLAFDSGEKVASSYRIDAGFGSTAQRVVIYSKNGIYLFNNQILLNIKAKDVYGENIFYTNAILSPGDVNFIGYYGEANCELVEIFSHFGLKSSNLYLTMRYNDLRYYIPNIFIVGHGFPEGAEFASADGDNVSIYSDGSCSMCVCMDHIL